MSTIWMAQPDNRTVRLMITYCIITVMMSPLLQVVDQRKLEKVDAKLKSKLEKKALKDMEEMALATKRYTVVSW